MTEKFRINSAAVGIALLVATSAYAQAPSIVLTATAPSGWTAPAQVRMTAAIAGGTRRTGITTVQFYVDGALVGTESTAPFTIETPLQSAKAYTLTAVGRNRAGVEVASSELDVATAASAWKLTANPESISSGGSSLLTFTTATTNVHNLIVSGRRPNYTCSTLGCSGSLVVNPTVTTTYTLTSTNDKDVNYPPLVVSVTVGSVAPEVPPVEPPVIPPVVLPPVVVPPVVVPPVVEGAPGDLPRLQKEHIVYEGSFSLPVGDINGSRFGYGATALGFDRETGTLFMVGHDWYQMATEITIPELRDARTMSLVTATPVQRFYDPTDGLWTQAGGSRDMVKVGGLLPWGNKLVVSSFSYYDANASQQASHVIGSRDLSVPDDARGLTKVGSLKTGYTSGYMAVVPEVWRGALGGPALAGNCCIPIVSRTSFGPALFTFNPDAIGTQAEVPAQPLVYYPEDKPLQAWDATSLLFNGTSKIGGVAFPEGTSSVIFFGQHGIGPFCYGTTCFPGAGQSPNAPPYISQAWAYDARDLAAVRAGAKQPWDVKPYATWEFLFPSIPASKYVNGVAYDPATQRIFLSQANEERPLIHVYKVRP